MDSLPISRRAGATALALMLALAGCAGTTPSAAPPSTAPSTAATTAPSAPAETTGALPGEGITLTAWLPSETPVEMQEALDAYAAKTGVKIEGTNFPNPFEQNLLARWAAGDRPDILFWHGAGNWIVQLNPSETLIPMDDQPFVARTLPGLLDATTKFRGTIYGAVLRSPFSYGMSYNKAFFAEHGLQEPTGGGYDAILGLCEQIKAADPNVAPIFMAGGDQWPLQAIVVGMWADDVTPDYARKLNTREATFNDPQFVDWIAKEKELVDKGCFNKDILTATWDDELAAVIDGKAVMEYQGHWYLDGMIENNGVDKVEAEIGWFPISGKGNVVSWEIPSMGTVYVPKSGDAKKEELAKGFVDYITGEGYEAWRQATNDFPVIKDHPNPENVSPLRLEIQEAYAANGMPIFQQVLEAAYGPFETFLQEMVAGTKTPQEVGAALQAEFDRSAQQVGLPGF